MRARAIKACIGFFDALLSRSDLEPEQRLEIERCRDRIRELGRKRNPSEAEVFRCIRTVSESIYEAMRNK